MSTPRDNDVETATEFPASPLDSWPRTRPTRAASQRRAMQAAMAAAVRAMRTSRVGTTTTNRMSHPAGRPPEA